MNISVGSSIREIDNTGKVFFATKNRRSTKVFRLSCELHDSVNGEMLSEALRETVRQFPFFQVEVCKDVFWYRLRSSNLQPVALREVGPPCGDILYSDSRSLLYEVSYAGTRIHLEVFHALTDGMGASCFLRMLVITYLSIVHKIPLGAKSLHQWVGIEAPFYETDDFSLFYQKPQGNKPERFRRAYQPDNTLLSGNQNSVISCALSVAQVLGECHQRGITITELLTAVYIKAIHTNMQKRKRPVVIALPVNLRKYFRSQTLRNFFAMIHVKYDFNRCDHSIDAILKYVHDDFTKQLNPESLCSNFSRYVSLERSPALRWIPIQAKNAGLRFAGWLSDRCITSVFSNLGEITLPEPFSQYVYGFDFIDKTDSIKLCVASYQDRMVINFTSALKEEAIQQSFFEILNRMGIKPHYHSSPAARTDWRPAPWNGILTSQASA